MENCNGYIEHDMIYEVVSSGFSGNPCLSNKPQKCLDKTRKGTLSITKI